MHLSCLFAILVSAGYPNALLMYCTPSSTKDGIKSMRGRKWENVSRRLTVAPLADHYFANAEKGNLQSLPLSQQPFRFFEYWTLKEAYIKARGMGLSIPLDRFSFDVTQAGRIDLHVDPCLEDDAERWMFWQWSLDQDYLLALCAQRNCNAATPSVQLWRALPLLTSQTEDTGPLRTSHSPSSKLAS